MKISMPKKVELILEKLQGNGYQAFVVGGCVRDSLLGNMPHDWDICTDAKPEEVIKAFSGFRVLPTGLRHGTVTVLIKGEGFEVTTFRTDGEYCDHRHPAEVTFVTDLRSDLLRRDFTVNAMACDKEGSITDISGGLQDLKEQRIRCVGDPVKRFSEDALRILRAMRFASVYGFAIEQATADAIHTCKGLLKNIAAERIQTELKKMIMGKNILSIMLDFSDVFGLIIPGMKACIGFEQNNRYHQYTVYGHIAHAVAHYQGDDLYVKLALLFHDIGKPLCYTEDEKGGHFYGHAAQSAQLTRTAMRHLRFSNEEIKTVLPLVEYHDTIIEPTPKCARRWLSKLDRQQVKRLLDIRKADIMAHREGTQESRFEKVKQSEAMIESIIAQEDCFSLKDLKINGRDLLALGFRGKEIGAALSDILNEVLAGNIPNEREFELEAAKNAGIKGGNYG